VAGTILLLASICPATGQGKLELVEVGSDGSGFIRGDDRETFRPWGVNYDHNENTGGLIEDYWEDEWEVVVEDFREIRELGANVVRIHLQTGKFMASRPRTGSQGSPRGKRAARASRAGPAR